MCSDHPGSTRRTTRKGGSRVSAMLGRLLLSVSSADLYQRRLGWQTREGVLRQTNRQGRERRWLLVVLDRPKQAQQVGQDLPRGPQQGELPHELPANPPTPQRGAVLPQGPEQVQRIVESRIT